MEDKRCDVCDKSIADHTYLDQKECYNKKRGYGQDWTEKEKVYRNEEV